MWLDLAARLAVPVVLGSPGPVQVAGWRCRSTAQPADHRQPGQLDQEHPHQQTGQPARLDQRQPIDPHAEPTRNNPGRSATAQALDRPARWGSPARPLIAACGSIWRPGWRCRPRSAARPGPCSRLALLLDRPASGSQAARLDRGPPARPGTPAPADRPAGPDQPAPAPRPAPPSRPGTTPAAAPPLRRSTALPPGVALPVRWSPLVARSGDQERQTRHRAGSGVSAGARAYSASGSPVASSLNRSSCSIWSDSGSADARRSSLIGVRYLSRIAAMSHSAPR